MKTTALLLALALHPLPAHALRGGSGGTTGGNPVPIVAPKFNQDPLRAEKLRQAVQILRERVPHSCFPRDYNNALLAEMDRLLATDQVFYFPESVMLGFDRYAGDYGRERLPVGDRFYKVGAFTEKAKGSPIYFTRDSDAYDAEELAMTFAQDLNDHVLQWQEERDLNRVGAMVAGREPCVPNDWGVYRVFELFPEREPEFESRKAAFYSDLAREQANSGKGTFKLRDLEGRDLEITPTGFRFTAVNFHRWDGIKGVYEVLPVRHAPRLELVWSPFHYVKQQNLADFTHALTGIVRDPSTGVTVMDVSYHFQNRDASFASRLLVDFPCDSREYPANNSIRLNSWRAYGEQTYAPRACTLRVANGEAELIVLRDPKAFCQEHRGLDFFSYVKTTADLAKETACSDREPRASVYAEIVGDREPEDYVRELTNLNETAFRQSAGMPAGAAVPWMHKNVFGGRLSYLGDRLAITRDEEGRVLSVYVPIDGTFLTTEGDEISLDDDDDEAYQCFFRGSLAGQCARRSYDD